MDPVAESWELSVHPDGPSIVASGEYQGLSFPKYLEKKGLNVTVICPQSTSTDAEEDNNVVRLHGRRGILELR